MARFGPAPTRPERAGIVGAQFVPGYRGFVPFRIVLAPAPAKIVA
jgi:hypothetical protein